jgi:AsmA-like C-terminal region
LQTAATGEAQSDLQIRGAWPGWASGGQNFSGPQVTGTARLHNVRIPLHGTGTPAEVFSANVQLLADSVRVEKLNAKAANSVWAGSLEMARGCGAPGQCAIHFDLKSNHAVLDDLRTWVNPAKDRPWYRLLQASAAPLSFLGSVRASGRITMDRFDIRNFTANHVNGNLALANGDLSITELRADVLRGKYAGEWKTDFRRSPVLYSSSGNFRDVSLDDIAKMMKDEWIRGTANGTYQLAARGNSEEEFWQSVEGSIHFQAGEGELPHILLEDPGPLKFTDFSGIARVRAREIELRDATLDTAEGTFQVSGTTSSMRELQFKLLPQSAGSQGYSITGTLGQPHVSAISHAQQARLKR